jgi:N-acetylglucosamine-6-phosphate deacetylase
MRLVGRRYDNGQAVQIEIEQGTIAACVAYEQPDAADLPWLAPGFIDLQVNGFGGQNFTDPHLTTEAVESISASLRPFGIARYLPTIITQSWAIQSHAVSVIAQAIEQSPSVRQRVAGIHLEGPYISLVDGPRGAHPLHACRPPDWDEFRRLQDMAGGQIRLITLSPEYPEAPAFIRHAVDCGVLVSIGHTNANSEQIQAAVDAGARMSTHLGNGSHIHLHRHRNYVWDQLADDRLTASLIADGFHLPPAMLKSLIRGKQPERIVLVSDITGLAGLVGSEPGLYETAGLGRVEVLADGRPVVAGQQELLAGAIQPLHVGIANVMRHAQVSLAEAVDMASTRPARLLGLPFTPFTVGAPADLVRFRYPVPTPGLEILPECPTG